jgi:hypothetical protein
MGNGCAETFRGIVIMRTSFGSVEAVMDGPFRNSDLEGKRILIRGEVLRDEQGDVISLCNATVEIIEGRPRFQIELPEDAELPYFAQGNPSTAEYMKRIRGGDDDVLGGE